MHFTLQGDWERMAWIIGTEQTRELLDMRGALRLLETMFRDRAAGKMRSVPRRRLKGSSKQLNVMAAWHADFDLIALRSYAGGAANTITLHDGRSGAIKAIVSGAYLSSLRTGAASGVAAKYLAPPGSKVVGLIGPGWQGTFQLEAVDQACKPQKVLVYGRNPKRRRNFISQMRSKVKASLEESESLREVEERSDIVVLATDSSSTILNGDRLKDQVLVITMGANQPVKHEVSLKLIKQMDLVVTDDLPTAMNDSGDLIAACKKKILRWHDVRPLETFVSGKGPKKRRAKILFQSNGIADEDLAVAQYVMRKALRKKLPLRSIEEI